MSANDNILAIAVALIGRAGPARERLREVLALAGAQVVLEEDPVAIDAQTLREAGPAAVLVVLEPAIEDVLETLEPALHLPGLTVVFDEAKLVMSRQGWDAQRWTRHLAAKLQGHGDVLPPGTEPEPAVSQTMAAAAGPAVLPSIAGGLVPPLPASNKLGDSSTWGLVDEVVVTAPARSAPDISALPDSGLSLVELDEHQQPRVNGAVLVIAGIGGPDAIRRLLSALPADFPRALLVHMALDGGQYGNLVRQLGRVSVLPVELGEPGQYLLAGKVYVLPDALGIENRDGALMFVSASGPSALLAALPAADSAVLMLSGASQTLVDDVLALAAQGAWVAGQSSHGCYDPAAASRLALEGKPCSDPAQLAQALAARWPR